VGALSIIGSFINCCRLAELKNISIEVVTEGQLPGLTNRAAMWGFRVRRDASGAIRYQLVL